MFELFFGTVLYLFGALLVLAPLVVLWSVQAVLGVVEALQAVRSEKTRQSGG